MGVLVTLAIMEIGQMRLSTSVLIVDSDDLWRNNACEFLRKSQIQAAGVNALAVALEQLPELRPEVLVIFNEARELDIAGVASTLRTIRPEAQILLTTNRLSINAATISGLPCVHKSEGFSRLLTSIQECTAGRRQHISQEPTRPAEPNPFLGKSSVIRALETAARRIVRSNCPILILGETGVGKGILARWIHKNSSRSGSAFVDVNCAGFARELIESELFGHEKGAFTGAITQKQGLVEVADRGTLFLDEIGDMDIGLQPKLLKVLEERRFRRLGSVKDRAVDVRFIAATHEDLPALVANKSFRSDLYFRINAVSITVPPLRERLEDIGAIARTLLAEVASRDSHKELGIADDAILTLQNHTWPGNVRELRNVIQRAAVFASGSVIQECDLHIERRFDADAFVSESQRQTLTLEQIERMYIDQMLELESGHVGRAANRLGIPRSTLYSKLKQSSVPASLDQAEAPPTASA